MLLARCPGVRYLALAALAWPTTSGAETLDELVQGHLRARGGLERLKAVETLRMTGTLSLGPGMQAPFTLELKRPNRMRAEFQLSGQTGVQAFDGRAGWILMPFAGILEPEPMSPDESRELAQQADFDGPLVDWRAKGHQLQLFGSAEHAGIPVWKLELTLASGTLRHLYLAKDSLLEVGSEGRREFGGNAIEFSSTLRDYREVDGVKLPFSIESGPKDEQRRQKMTFEKIEIGVALDDARFRLPGR